MSSRPQFDPYPVITNGDMSGNLTSKVTVVQKLSLVSYACSWAGSSPVGAVSVQVSNDYKQNAAGAVINAGTWNTLPLSAPTGVSGNTGNGFIDLDANAGYAMRLIYLAGSGTGLLNVIVTAKVA
jgi:hypothetical protein